MDKKIIEKYNYPKILEVDTWEKFKEFRNHFDDDVDESLALSFWKGNQHRKMCSEELSRVKSREENNDFKRDLARFIYNNCKTTETGIYTKANEIKLLLEKSGVLKMPKGYPKMMMDHWISPQALGEFYLDETLDSSLDGKRHLDDISKYFDYTRKAYLCIEVPKRLNDKLSSHSPISNNKKIEKYITEKKYDILEIPLYVIIRGTEKPTPCKAEIGSEYRNDFFTVPEGMTDWEISKYGAKTTKGSNLTAYMN